VETIGLGEPIDAAIAQLTAANVRGLVVVDGDRAVGVFTQIEAIKARALSAELRKTAVEQVMSYETLCLDVSTPLYRAAGHAIQMRVRRILAVEQRRFRGIVTGFDLVRVMTMDDA
jgi:CBS domain-containing protein